MVTSVKIIFHSYNSRCILIFTHSCCNVTVLDAGCYTQPYCHEKNKWSYLRHATAGLSQVPRHNISRQASLDLLPTGLTKQLVKQAMHYLKGF